MTTWPPCATGASRRRPAAGAAPGSAWSARSRPQRRESRPYTTIEALAQAVHDGLVDASDEQRAVLEQAWQIANRPRLTLLHGGGSDGP